MPCLSAECIAGCEADTEAAAFEVESLLSDPPHAVSVKEIATRATPANPIFRMPIFLFLIPLESAAIGTGRRRREQPTHGKHEAARLPGGRKKCITSIASF
jgi:hypothetical protein